VARRLLRADFATQVSAFLDRAEAADASHVTYLSIKDVAAAPATTAQRAGELDLESRNGLTHTILRPAWFMQNFDNFLKPVDGQIAVPTGDGAEAFIHVDDVATTATATVAVVSPPAPTSTPVPTGTIRQPAGRRASRKARKEPVPDWSERNHRAAMLDELCSLTSSSLG
jgi:uncharacterized protein YbjT (DUF2867 family)